MRYILAYVRLCLTAIIFSLGTLLILATSWMPFRIRGIRFSPWLVTWITRLLLPLYDIRVTSPHPDRIWQHHGMIFPNHSSYLDILVMAYFVPTRFMAKEEVRSWPFIGLVAMAVGTVFVKRESKESRAKARESLAKVRRYPPIVLYPEGKISTDKIPAPFRYGAFEIAIQNSIPFMPCAIVFDRPEIVEWGDETLLAAIWRLAARTGPVRAEVIPLEPVTPKPTDDPVRLSLQAHRAVTDALISRLPVRAAQL